MLIGLISDIHANLAALEAVLNDMPRTDLLLCCGDVVGYYAQPNETCERLRASGALCVRGNHDAYVIGALEPNPDRREAYRTDWTREQLTPANYAWLEQLPTERNFEFEGLSIRLRHASPWDEETYLYPDSPRLKEIRLVQNELLLVGHTHHPLAREAGDGMVVNPGSVGQPRDWNPRASYALLRLPSKSFDIRRVSYSVASVRKNLEDLGWDKKIIRILDRSR